MIGIVIAWGAIERHILVFYSHYLRSTRKQVIFHYIPLFSFILYGYLFYIVMIFFPPCENFYETILNIYDTIVNCIFPTILIIFFNITLLVKHIRQKQRVQQVIQWRKHRKIILQSFSVCLLFLIFYLPLLVLITAHFCGLPEEIGYDAEFYFYFLTYFIALLLPYVCVATFTDIFKKFNRNTVEFSILTL